MEPCQTKGATPSSGRGVEVKSVRGVRNSPSQSTLVWDHSVRYRSSFSTASWMPLRMSLPNQG